MFIIDGILYFISYHCCLVGNSTGSCHCIHNCCVLLQTKDHTELRAKAELDFLQHLLIGFQSQPSNSEYVSERVMSG